MISVSLALEYFMFGAVRCHLTPLHSRFGTSSVVKIVFALDHFEPEQIAASPCEKFCIHKALNWALAINKADLGDLQVPMS